MTLAVAEAVANQTKMDPEALKDTGPSEVSYVVDGAKCERTPSGDGCFLDAGQRTRLIEQFQHRAIEVHGNIRDALTQVGFERLLKKEEDLSWVTELVLTAFTMGLSKCLIAAAGAAKRAAAAHLAKQLSASRLARATQAVAAGEQGMKLLDKVSGAQVAGMVTGQVAAAAKTTIQGEGQEVEQKTDSLSFIERVRGEYDLAFQNMRERSPAMLSDAELMELNEAFDIVHHQKSVYKAMFAEKLARFESSGISSIGRKNATREPGFEVPHMMGMGAHVKHHVVRDTRVVWHTYVSGYPKQLVFESHDGEETLHIDEMKRVAGKQPPLKFGPRNAITEKAETGGPVPAEFVSYALQRHQQMWGEPPRTVHVDDSQSFDPMRVSAAMKNKSRGTAGSKETD